MSIRAFEAAARLGSFQAAADELGRVPSAVSHQIKHLEIQLGTTLFQKEGRNRILTADGKVYAEAIDRAFEEISRAGEQLASRQSPKSIRVRTSSGFMTLGILPRLAAFRQRFPQLELEFDIQSASDESMRDDVDAFVQMGRGDETDLVVERLWQSSWIPVTTPEFAREVGQTDIAVLRADFPLLHYKFHATLWDEWFALHAPGMKPCESGMLVDSGATGLALLESGVKGILLGLFPLMSELVRAGRVVVLKNEALTASEDYHLAYRRALIDTDRKSVV